MIAVTIMILFTVMIASADDKEGTFNKIERLQRSFVEKRFGMFICYNIMSYGAKWGQAKYPIDSVNPQELDCGQWADVAVSAGMSYGLLTTKHHEGFCLWDSETTEYDIAATPYKKDIVEQFVKAFRKRKLGVGLYYSVWDSTHGINRGKMNEKNMAFVKKQLTELLTKYGKIDFLFFDGWYWRMGHRKASFTEIRELIRKLQPDCLVSDNTHLQGYYRNDYVMFEGPFGAYPPKDNKLASAICDKIVKGNGWFWGARSPDSQCIDVRKTADKIKDLESRYCSFMLAVLPNRQGLLDDNQVACLKEIGQLWSVDNKRKPLPKQDPWVIYSIDPVSAKATVGNGDLAIDGIMHNKKYTHWETSDSYPQSITIDLGSVYSGLEVVTCMPAHKMGPERAIAEGNVTVYTISISDDNNQFKEVARGKWEADAKPKSVAFPKTTGRYVKFEVVEAQGPASVSEIDIGAFSTPPQKVNDD